MCFYFACRDFWMPTIQIKQKNIDAADVKDDLAYLQLKLPWKRRKNATD